MNMGRAEPYPFYRMLFHRRTSCWLIWSANLEKSRSLNGRPCMRPRSVAPAFFALLLLLLGPAIGLEGASRALAQEAVTECTGLMQTGPIEKVDLAKLFDTVVDTVNKSFFDQAALNQGHWRERAQAIRPSVLESRTIDDAVRQINQLLAELGASHTALYTPDDEQYYVLSDILARQSLARRQCRRTGSSQGSGPYFPGISAFTRNVDGRDFVDGVLEGSPADKAGLKFGDEILSVDERPYPV